MPVTGSSLRLLWGTALNRPRLVLLIALVAASVLSLQSLDLRFEAGIDLLSPDDPLSRAESRRQEIFWEDLRLLLALYKSDRDGGVLDEPSLAALAELHHSLLALPGILRVSSLVNAPALVASRNTPVGAMIWNAKEPNRKSLLRRLSKSELQNRLLLSQRESLTPIYLELTEDASEAAVVRDVERLARQVEADHPGAGDVLVVGPAVVETQLTSHIMHDLKWLVPLSIAAAGLLLLAFLRSLLFLVITLLHSAALVGTLLGGMALTGVSINLVTVLAPVILVPVGVADLLHLFVRLKSHGRGAPTDRAGALALAYARLERPMVLTSLTTAIGFLGFLISPVAAIREFGLIMSAGVLAALLISFTLDPALLMLLWRPRRAVPKPEDRRIPTIENWLRQAGSKAVLRQRSRRALAVCAVLAAVGILSLTQLRIDDTWIQNFDSRSRVFQDTRRFEGEFIGTNVLAAVIEQDSPDPSVRRQTLEGINRLTTSLTFALGIRGVLSPTLLARSLDPDQGRPWDPWPTPTLAGLAEAHAEWEDRGLPLPRARMFADEELRRFQMQFFVLNQPYEDLVKRVGFVEEELDKWLGGESKVTLGGNLAVNLRMVRVAVFGQALSLVALLVTISLLAIFLTRSVLTGAILILPMLLAILTTFTLLVALNIPYGVAVSMFPTLIIGLSVDFALHLRAALLRNRTASHAEWSADMAVVIRGIALNGSLWTLGFAVLIVSQMPPNRYLGLLCSIVVCLSTVLTLFLLPTAALRVARIERIPGSA